MKKSRRSLLGRTLSSLRSKPQRSRQSGRELERSLRFEFLESRQMMHGGGDPEYDPNTAFHIHYQLDIVVNGVQQLIPKGVGNNVGANSNKFHTHDLSGRIHVHPGPTGQFVTVDDFFDAWHDDTVLGNANAVFSSTSILGNVANATHTVRMYVNGTLNTDFENYEVHDEDKIVISYEPIASTNKPSLDPIGNQTVLGGAPLWLALDGIDPNGGPLTYSVSVQNPSLLTTSIPTTNQSMRIDVTDFGSMTFQLFDHLTPEVTERIKALIQAGFYDETTTTSTVQGSPTPTATAFAGTSALSSVNDFYVGQTVRFTSGTLNGQQARVTGYNGSTRTFTFATGSFTAAPAAGATFQVINQILFHRVVPDFVIQGGDPSGTGSGGSTLGDFDDQFHLDLQHTASGLLSMAKSSDDTNDSQFFVTDVPTRFLDFNHSIFGRLTDGEAIRNAINSTPVGPRNPALPFNAQTNPNERPLTPVVISNVELFNDTENGALMLKAAEGASGSTDVTVTVTDQNGNTFSRTFTVTVTPDTANSAPFLVNPATIHGVSGEQIQFQIQALDAENNTNFYDAAKPSGESVNYTLNVNNNTGLVTIDPPAGFVGSFEVIIGVRGTATTTTSDQFDTQRVTVTVEPANGLSIDLLEPANANEASNTDNITNAAGTNNPGGTLQFTISNVTSGALVKLMKGTNVLAQGTATGTSINLSTTNLGALGDGVHGLTATQTVSGIESDPSAILNVTLDTVSPVAITSTPPTEADVNTPLSYNAVHVNEGSPGFRYRLVTPPTGVVIDANTGVMTWTPLSGQVGQHTFGISAVDAAGNVTTQTVNITVDEPIPPQLEFFLRLANPDGSELTSLATGQDFILQVFSSDLRIPARGVFAGYTDIQWDPAKAIATGPVLHSATYPGQPDGTVSAGLIDEAGGFAGTAELGGGLHEVFRVAMRATSGGTLTFFADPADDLPANEVLLYGGTDGVPLEEIRYGTTSITINSTFNAVADTVNVNEDSTANTLNPLANDPNIGSATNVLTISALGGLATDGKTNNGGTVEITNAGTRLNYRPAANFSGTDTFTYTARNQSGETATATITVQVQPQNDAPISNADTLSVDRNSTANVLDVLANDSFAPDTGETLRVTTISAGSQGGFLSIGNGGANIRYTPRAGFTGAETFTYTISDRATGGLTAQGSVTVNVTSTNPTAVNDTATVAEDATTPVEINVLANDLLGEGTALTITAVGTASQGGTVAITQSGTRINYTPAANKQGTETFTYTISNGLGTSTGTVTVTITNSNDPPVAVADAVTGFKNTTVTFDLLANDTTGPDPAENLVIDTVTQPTNGSVQITESGKKVSFTPANNFTGSTTFTYTIKDPGGLTAGPVTVTVTVQEFAPSSLGGFVYFDSDNDGSMDGPEQSIANVTITLTGTDVNNAAVNRTVKTSADGSYLFNNLLPGNYTVKETQPALVIDGKDTAGSSGGNASTNDQFVITNLAQATNGIGYNFGERGRQTVAMSSTGQPVALFSLRDFYSSNARNYAIAAFDNAGNHLWYTTNGAAWDGYSHSTLTLLNNQSQIKIDVTNPSAQAVTATIPTGDDSRIYKVGTLNDQHLYRLRGGPAVLNFQPAPTAQSEGEGEEAPQASLLASPDSTDLAAIDYLYSTLDSGDEDEAPLPNPNAWENDAVDEAMSDLGNS